MDLRSFLAQLSGTGEIVNVKKEVSPVYEVSALVSRLEMEKQYPAVMYEKVSNSTIPVVTNLFASRKRLAIALGTTEGKLNEVYRKREDHRILPVLCENAPVQEVVLQGDDVNLYDLPVVTHNEKDVAPYISAGCMAVKDPETGIYNVGIYRHMLQGKNKIGIHLAETSHATFIYEKYCAMGKPMPVAITIGHHPAFYLATVSFVPLGISEYEVAGGLMQEPLALTKCISVDLEVPAMAEIVLEGEIHPTERALEAPFGEFTKLYGKQRQNPVVTIKTITMRKKPIYLDCFSGHLDHQLLGGTGRLSVIYKAVRAACPTVRDIFMPPSGSCRLSCYISIKKRHEGEAKNAIMAAFGADPFIRFGVVFDEDVDIFKDYETINAIVTRTDAAVDCFIVKGAKGHPLDPMAQKEFLVTKVGIDATKPMTGFGDTVRVPGADTLRIEDYLA